MIRDGVARDDDELCPYVAPARCGAAVAVGVMHEKPRRGRSWDHLVVAAEF